MSLLRVFGVCVLYVYLIVLIRSIYRDSCSEYEIWHLLKTCWLKSLNVEDKKEKTNDNLVMITLTYCKKRFCIIIVTKIRKTIDQLFCYIYEQQ